MANVSEILEKIKARLKYYMHGRIYPSEIATTFNFVLYDEFTTGGLKPVFVGQYFIDPSDPSQTRVFCHQGSEACSPIPISKRIIGRSVRTGENQHVPDVTLDENHIGCDPNMEGCEIVLVAWSDPYTKGENSGKKVPIGVLDIDLGLKNITTEEDVRKLESIWEEYGKMIFPGGAEYQPGEKMAVRC